jgi:hypothetical protein
LLPFWRRLFARGRAGGRDQQIFCRHEMAVDKRLHHIVGGDGRMADLQALDHRVDFDMENDRFQRVPDDFTP